MSDAEFCPSASALYRSDQRHAWLPLPELRLDGVVEEQCTNCFASRVTLQVGLGAFLEALTQTVIEARHQSWCDGRESMRGELIGVLFRTDGERPESGFGPNQEHAQKAVWTRPTVRRAQPIEGEASEHWEFVYRWLTDDGQYSPAALAVKKPV